MRSLALVLALAAPAGALDCSNAASLSSAIRVALSQYKAANACGQGHALKWLNALFKDGVPKQRAADLAFNGPDSDPSSWRRPQGAKLESTPITSEILDLAVAHLDKRIQERRIAGACTRDDVSGYWAVDPHGCSGSLCGKIELGQGWVAKLQRSDFRSEMQLRDADQVANSLTHEVSHMLVSYFRRVYDADDQPTIGDLQEQFTYYTFFTGCGLYELGGFQGRKNQPVTYKAPSHLYDPSRTGNEQAARMIAHGMQLCSHGKPNPYYSAILGNPRADTCTR